MSVRNNRNSDNNVKQFDVNFDAIIKKQEKRAK